MPTLLTALLRTVVPAVVGYVLALPLVSGLRLDSEALTVIVAGVLTSVYYSVGYSLGSRWPRLGSLLLGLGAGTGGPTYPNASMAGRRLG